MEKSSDQDRRANFEHGRALDVWLDFLAHASLADEPAFEVLCRRRPELAEELRTLRERGRREARERLTAERVTDAARGESSLLERLKSLAKPIPRGAHLQREGELARGGMGTVHRVRDLELDRMLALKEMILAPAEQHPLAAARFLEEAQVTAQLDHPGIVPVQEIGVDSEGRLYFAMKLVQGRDLRTIFELVREGREGWNQTRAVSVLLKVCEAMAYAHSKGVIHRDLKPGNVMVGSFGEVYVMDWGLARVMGRRDVHDLRLKLGDAGDSLHTERREEREESPDSPLVTMDGTVVGTPTYMSPEQARGEVQLLLPCSDVYSIGAMLYHLLTGEVPYVPARARISKHAILARVAEGPPRPLRELNPNVPAELEAICEKAMAREQGERYPDTLALGDDLRAYLEHRVVAAYETGAAAELRKWVKRNKALSAASAVAVLALIAGLVVALVLKAQSDHNLRLAEQNAETAKANEQRALEGEASAKEEGRRADREAKAATQRAEEVLRLSAIQKLDDLVAEADGLWPAHPGNLEKFEAWLAQAEELFAELPEHEAKLAELRARAAPRTEAEPAAPRAPHPRAGELASARQHLEFLRRQEAALLADTDLVDPSPLEVGVDFASLPANPNRLNMLAWPLVKPERKEWGGEAKGLVLARRAVELAPQGGRAAPSDTLAWALFAAGRFDEAISMEKRAVEQARPETKAELLASEEKLRKAIKDHLDPQQRSAQRLELEAEIAALEVEVAAHSEWTFADTQDKWWHNQLEKLVIGLWALSDSQTGLYSDGTSEQHGWGMMKRLEFASTITELSLSGGEAAARWAEAVASIADASKCPKYAGLRIQPQLGLLPIGRDPQSGLWEFAHLATGTPAERGADGKLILTESVGLVFVLLPGGTFLMGAQSTDPAKPNFDPGAGPDEGPPHEVKLKPFFLSKYEMTQGQWLRFTGGNPSRDTPQTSSPSWNAAGKPADLLHPVEQVSWIDCARVLERIGLEFPSEGQWEYGARAETTTVWWCGDEKETVANAGNVADVYARNHGASTMQVCEPWSDGNTSHASVGSYLPNRFGLHDVLGNVREWCTDSFAWGSQDRVSRGGSFTHPTTHARSTHRSNHAPSFANINLGLRPARNLSAQ